MQISIIVPIYNVEKYLERCIKSIINQTYKNIEIILVNDGSTDKSIEIIKKYKEIDNRIKIINKKNGGLADARNEGTKKANGEYILYVDSDDDIKETTCEELINIIEKTKADLICFNCNILDENKNNKPQKVFNSENTKEIIELTYEEAMKDSMYRKHIRYSACVKLYKKELAQNIRFPKGMLAEDFATFYIFLKHAKKIVYYDSCLYNYYERTNSIMNSKTKKLYNDVYITETKYNKILKETCTTKKEKQFNNSRHFRILLKLYCMTENKAIEKEIYRIKDLKIKEKILKIIFTISKKITITMFKKIYKGT